jgi:hypothetical protein
MQNTEQNTTTFKLTRTQKANGEFNYQVLDNTGKVHATRNSRREYVAAVFQILQPGFTKPHSIDNGIGRVDLVHSALRGFEEADRQSLMQTGLSTSGQTGLAYLELHPAPQPTNEPTIEADDRTSIQDLPQGLQDDKVRCSMVVASHRNDHRIDGQDWRLEFANWLEERYLPYRWIDPHKEYEIWKQNKPEPTPTVGLVEGFRQSQAQSLAEAYLGYRHMQIINSGTCFGFWDWLDEQDEAYKSKYTKEIQEMAMDIILDELEKAKEDQAGTPIKDQPETILEQAYQEATGNTQEATTELLETIKQLTKERDEALKELETARKTIHELNEAGNGEQAALIHDLQTEVEELRAQNFATDLDNTTKDERIQELKDALEQEKAMTNEVKRLLKHCQSRVQERDQLLEETQKQIQETMEALQQEVDPGSDPGMAISDVLAATQEEPEPQTEAAQESPEEILYKQYVDHIKKAGYTDRMVLKFELFSGLLNTGSREVKAAGRVWSLDQITRTKPTERPIAEQQANLARRLQLLDDIRILEEVGLISIDLNDIGEPYIKAPTRIPDEGDQTWIAKQ